MPFQKFSIPSASLKLMECKCWIFVCRWIPFVSCC